MLEQHRSYIVPRVDEVPEILENRLLRQIQLLGYTDAFIYSDVEKKGRLTNLDEVIRVPYGLPGHPRIETPDSKLLVVQNFDQRFTYILGQRTTLSEIIRALDLEGFFCDQKTSQSWSY